MITQISNYNYSVFTYVIKYSLSNQFNRIKVAKLTGNVINILTKNTKVWDIQALYWYKEEVKLYNSLNHGKSCLMIRKLCYKTMFIQIIFNISLTEIAPSEVTTE